MERLRLCKQCLLEKRGECRADMMAKAIEEHSLIPEVLKPQVTHEWVKSIRKDRNCPKDSPLESASGNEIKTKKDPNQ